MFSSEIATAQEILRLFYIAKDVLDKTPTCNGHTEFDRRFWVLYGSGGRFQKPAVKAQITIKKTTRNSREIFSTYWNVLTVSPSLNPTLFKHAENVSWKIRTYPYRLPFSNRRLNTDCGFHRADDHFVAKVFDYSCNVFEKYRKRPTTVIWKRSDRQTDSTEIRCYGCGVFVGNRPLTNVWSRFKFVRGTTLGW